MLHTLLYRCVRICSDWTNFHLELVKLIDVFKNNGYPENFINNFLKVFLDNKYRVREKVITVPKKTLFLVLPYVGPLSLQTRTKLRKSLKDILNCCKFQILLKVKTNWQKLFVWKLFSSMGITKPCTLLNPAASTSTHLHPAPSISTHLHPAPSTSTQLYSRPSSSFKPPPSSLQHLQRYNNQNIPRNWAISPNLGRKFKVVRFA